MSRVLKPVLYVAAACGAFLTLWVSYALLGAADFGAWQILDAREPGRSLFLLAMNLPLVVILGTLGWIGFRRRASIVLAPGFLLMLMVVPVVQIGLVLIANRLIFENS